MNSGSWCLRDPAPNNIRKNNSFYFQADFMASLSVCCRPSRGITVTIYVTLHDR